MLSSKLDWFDKLRSRLSVACRLLDFVSPESTVARSPSNTIAWLGRHSPLTLKGRLCSILKCLGRLVGRGFESTTISLSSLDKAWISPDCFTSIVAELEMSPSVPPVSCSSYRELLLPRPSEVLRRCIREIMVDLQIELMCFHRLSS